MIGRLRRLGAWLDDRTGWGGAVRALLDEPVPGGARWWYAIGGTLTFLLALEFATGVLLSFYYAPSAATAWASVAYIQDQVTMGWFVRGLHSFGSSAIIVVAGLHFLQVLLFGAYKAPREANWFIGLALFGLMLVFAMSGYGLPWDQKGYWAKAVETSILGTSPGFGPALEKVIQGGATYGSFTVVHFYAAHVLVLPILTVLLVALHIGQVRRHRVTPPWMLSRDQIDARTEPYWPGQAFRDTAASLVACAALVFFVVKLHGAELEGPADAASGYMARPEWYARPLYQLRMLFEGPMEMIATMVIPGIAALLLGALPFLDRAPSHDPRARKPVLVGVAAGIAVTCALGVYSVRKDARDQSFQRQRVEVETQAAFARTLARKGVLPEGGLAVYRNDPQFAVREIWRDECAKCHALTGAGGDEGPDLHDYNSRAWILAFLKDPQGPRFMGPAKKEKGMKPVTGTPDELAALTEFVYAQTGARDVDTGLASKGEAMFPDKNCDACHELDGTTDAKGPNLLHRGTLAYVEKVIEHAGLPELYGDRAKMPKFVGKFTPEQLDALARFVIAQKKT